MTLLSWEYMMYIHCTHSMKRRRGALTAGGGGEERKGEKDKLPKGRKRTSRPASCKMVSGTAYALAVRRPSLPPMKCTPNGRYVTVMDSSWVVLVVTVVVLVVTVVLLKSGGITALTGANESWKEW